MFEISDIILLPLLLWGIVVGAERQTRDSLQTITVLVDEIHMCKIENIALLSVLFSSFFLSFFTQWLHSRRPEQSQRG